MEHNYRTAIAASVIAGAVTTPVATLVSDPFVSRIDPPLLGLLLALSAGALIYVGTTHLRPRAEREPRRTSLIAAGAGIAVAIGIVLSGS